MASATFRLLPPLKASLSGVLTAFSRSGGTSVKWVGVLICMFLLSTPVPAEQIDKSKLLEITKRDCPAQILDNKALVDALHVRGGDLDSFCECAAARFVSQIEDTDSGNPVSTALKWNGAQAFCLGSSKKQ